MLSQPWWLVLTLLVGLTAMRAYGMIGPPGKEAAVMVGFLIMCFLPLIFFSRSGRRAMGIRRPSDRRWYLWAPLLGMAATALVGVLGLLLFGNGADNWFVSVRGTYLRDPAVLSLGTGVVFLIFTVPAMIFSPIGEELLFRGMTHEAARERWGTRVATAINAAAFGAVHILHHGISRGASGLEIQPVSGLLWVLLMTGLGWLFTECRERSGSIWPAVLSHSGANLAMNVMIFFTLDQPV